MFLWIGGCGLHGVVLGCVLNDQMNIGAVWGVLNCRPRGHDAGVPTSEGGWWLLVFIFSNRQSPAVVPGWYSL